MTSTPNGPPVFASGNVPDMSTARRAQVAEMINVDALTPINDLIDDIGRDKFAPAAIAEGTMEDNNYSLPFTAMRM